MKNNWISVEDKLPDSEKDVLVYTFNGSFEIGFYSSNSKKWIFYELTRRELKVTHWQPLEKPVIKR